MNILVLGNSALERSIIQKLNQTEEAFQLFQWPFDPLAGSLALNVSDDSTSIEFAEEIKNAEIDFCINFSGEENVCGLGNVLQTLRIPLFGCNNLSNENQGYEAYLNIATNDLGLGGELSSLIEQNNTLTYCAFVSSDNVCHMGITKESNEKETSPVVLPHSFMEILENKFIQPILKLISECAGYAYNGWLEFNLVIKDSHIFLESYKTVATRDLLQTYIYKDKRDWLTLIAQLLGFSTLNYECAYFSPDRSLELG